MSIKSKRTYNRIAPRKRAKTLVKRYQMNVIHAAKVCKSSVPLGAAERSNNNNCKNSSRKKNYASLNDLPWREDRPRDNHAVTQQHRPVQDEKLPAKECYHWPRARCNRKLTVNDPSLGKRKSLHFRSPIIGFFRFRSGPGMFVCLPCLPPFVCCMFRSAVRFFFSPFTVPPPARAFCTQKPPKN